MCDCDEPDEHLGHARVLGTVEIEYLSSVEVFVTFAKAHGAPDQFYWIPILTKHTVHCQFRPLVHSSLSRESCIHLMRCSFSF
jgi:hypothetical protein